MTINKKTDATENYPWLVYSQDMDAIDDGGGGSSVIVEPLSVTENGTYSETGKAYSPVTVDVSGGTEYGAIKPLTFEFNGEPDNFNLTIMAEEGLKQVGNIIVFAAAEEEYEAAAGTVIAVDTSMPTNTATITIDDGDPQPLRLIIDEEYETCYFVFTVPSEGDSIVINVVSE